MKVLLILDRPDSGEVSRAALDICRNSHRFGLDMSVAVLSAGALEDEFRHSGSTFFSFRRENALDLNCVYGLRKIVRSEGISIVHSMGSVEALHASLATLANRSTKRVLSHPGTMPNEHAVSGRFGLRALARMTDANLLPLRVAFKSLRRLGIDTSGRFFYLPPPIDRVRLLPAGNSFRAELGINQTDVLMGMSATFDPDSGADQMTVCKALPAVFEKYPQAYFVFVGGVEGKGDLLLEDCADFCDRAGIGDRVFFAGERTDTNQVLDSLSLFIYSAKNDNLPLSLLEAMTAGVPAIISDNESLIELTGFGKCAEVFVRGDEDELASKAVALIKNERLRRLRSRESSALAAALYSVESHLASLKTLYSELIDSPYARGESKPEEKAATQTGGDSVLGLD